MSAENPTTCELYGMLYVILEDLIGEQVTAIEQRLLLSAFGSLCAAAKIHEITTHGGEDHEHKCTIETGTNRSH